jgi:hypothetical protein
MLYQRKYQINIFIIFISSGGVQSFSFVRSDKAKALYSKGKNLCTGQKFVTY